MEDMDIDEEEEQDMEKNYNLSLYTNLRGTINLNQDNKYKFYISNDNYKGKRKYRCIEYKNSTLKNNEKCLAYFVS